jgi:modulator of FtsH protease
MATVSAAYDHTQWSDFAIAVAGAAAALAGLLVVAVSINIQPIVADPHLPERAATAIIELVAPLIVAVCLLIPGQSPDVVGVELIAVGVILAIALVHLNRLRDKGPHRTVAMWMMTSGAPTVLLPLGTLLAGLGLITGALGGLYWVAVAVLAAFVFGLIQAWTLLIEILR